MKICNWKYLYDEKNGFQVIPPKRITKPKSFVKYYSLKEYNIEALINGKFYFSHPLILNDPFDSCIQMIDLCNFTKSEYSAFYNKHRSDILPNKCLNDWEIERLIENKYKLNIGELIKLTKNYYWNFIFENFGILSLSTNDNSLLMWSYYTNNEGFAIRLDDVSFMKNVYGPFPINYSDNYEIIKPKEIAIKNEQLLYVTNIKSNKWKHEHEWRYLYFCENMSIPEYPLSYPVDYKRCVNYNASSISIIIGYKFFKGFLTKPVKNNSIEYEVSAETDPCKNKLLEWIIENNVVIEQIQTRDDKSFRLTTKKILIERLKKNAIYLVHNK